MKSYWHGRCLVHYKGRGIKFKETTVRFWKTTWLSGRQCWVPTLELCLPSWQIPGFAHSPLRRPGCLPGVRGRTVINPNLTRFWQFHSSCQWYMWYNSGQQNTKEVCQGAFCDKNSLLWVNDAPEDGRVEGWDNAELLYQPSLELPYLWAAYAASDEEDTRMFTMISER